MYKKNLDETYDILRSEVCYVHFPYTEMKVCKTVRSLCIAQSSNNKVPSARS